MTTTPSPARPRSPGCGRRIDYIWLSADLEASGFTATTGTASDHRGIAVTVGPAS